MRKLALSDAQISIIVSVSMLLVVCFSLPALADHSPSWPDHCFSTPAQCWLADSCMPDPPRGGQCNGSFEAEYQYYIDHPTYWPTHWYGVPESGCCPGTNITIPAGLVFVGTTVEEYYPGCSFTYGHWEFLWKCAEVVPDDCTSSPITCPEGKVGNRVYPGCWYTCICPNAGECASREGNWVLDNQTCECKCNPNSCLVYPKDKQNPDTCACECNDRVVGSCPVDDRVIFDPETCQCSCGDYATSIDCRLLPLYNSNAISMECNIHKRTGGSTGWTPLHDLSEGYWYIAYLPDGKDMPYDDWYFCDAWGNSSVIDGNAAPDCQSVGAKVLNQGTWNGIEIHFWNMTCNFDDWGWMKTNISSVDMTAKNQGFNVDTGYDYSAYVFLWGVATDVQKGTGGSLLQTVEKRGHRLRLSRGGYEKRDN
jgi:hypothetical protein